jgi:hypothetical protein
MEGTAAPLKASFSVQAGALLRKNLRYQRKNWCVQRGRQRGRQRGAGEHAPQPQILRRLTCALSALCAPAAPTAASCSRRSSSPSCWAVRAPAAAAPRRGSTKVPHTRTPLTPSSHLSARRPRAVVSFVINNILLSGAEYKCGCLCKEYTAPDGYVFAFANVRPFARERRTARGACR